MWRVGAVVLGALSGAGLGVGLLFVVARVDGALVGSQWVLAIAAPGAHVASWALGWPLQQEAALACYALGLLGEVALLGAITGALAGALATGERNERAGRG